MYVSILFYFSHFLIPEHFHLLISYSSDVYSLLNDSVPHAKPQSVAGTVITQPRSPELQQWIKTTSFPCQPQPWFSTCGLQSKTIRRKQRFSLWLITVVKLPLWSATKIILWLGEGESPHHEDETVRKGHSSIREVENHCSSGYQATGED